MPECSLKELGGRIARFERPKGVSEGVVFRCPTCPDEWRHSIVVTWSGPSLYPSGAVWTLESAPETSALTLSPSINCDVPPVYPPGWSDEDKREDERTRCRFHGWVKNGKATW
jgi:hypothetical protein